MKIYTWRGKKANGQISGPFTVPVEIRENGTFLKVLDGYWDLTPAGRQETGYSASIENPYVTVERKLDYDDGYDCSGEKWETV